MTKSIAYIAFGHVDVTLPLINELHKKNIHCDLYFCFAQNRKSESVIDFRTISVPNGLLEEKWNESLIDKTLLEYYPFLLKANFFIFKSLRIKSIKNIILTLKLAFSLRNRKIIHASGDSGTLPLLFFILKIFGKKLVFTVHDLKVHSGEKKSKFQSLFRNAIYFLSNKVLLQNPVDYEYAKKTSKILKRKGVLLPFGVMCFYSSYNNLKYDNKLKSDFLFFGRISQYKGLQTLYKAVSKIKSNSPDVQFSLVIAGSGSDESLVLFQKLNDVTVINRFVGNDELANLIHNTKVVVCPYTDATQSGVLMTAFAFKKPVIASRVGGFTDILSSYQTGWLVEPSNEDDLSLKIYDAVINMDQFTLDCQKGIDRLMKESPYSWHNISKRLSEIYEELF